MTDQIFAAALVWMGAGAVGVFVAMSLGWPELPVLSRWQIILLLLLGPAGWGALLAAKDMGQI